MVASLIKRLCPAPLKQKIKLACGVPDIDACLAAMKQRGFRPRIAIDIGAYTGEWTLSLRQLFPETRVLMVEPQTARHARLQELAQTHDGVELAPVLLGSREAKAVTFSQSETASSVLRDPGNGGARAIEMEMTTLDAITRRTYSNADLLKLDVQGYELEVLKGAEQVLASVEAVMMEVDLIAVYEGAPLVDEVVAFMAARGFRVYDVCTFFRRPLDNALWQMDMIFVRATFSSDGIHAMGLSNFEMRICVITAGHLATCPRMVKAAGALAEAGHDVRAVSAQFLDWAAEADRPLAPPRWSAVDYRRHTAPATYWRTAIELHAARYRVSLIGARYAPLGMLAAANGRAARDLLKLALAEPADLFYGGTRGGLAIAALAAQRAGVPFGIDLEDFHEGESAGQPCELIRHLQRRVLPRAAFVTAGSCAIASRYEADYGVPVLPIHNTFPLPAHAPDPEPPGNGALRLYWFSQTIGADRGLDDVVRAIEMSGIRAELHLRGAGVFHHPQIPVHIHPPAPPEQMIDLCRPYDIGLSPEAGRTLNRELCLGNKALTYILGGLAVVLSDTAGQRQLGCELGEGALRYKPGDVASLAAGLKRWAQDRAALRRARVAAWNAARNRWHWEHRHEKGALIAAVEGALP